MKIVLMSLALLFSGAVNAATATEVCEGIHGKSANVDLLDFCVVAYEQFNLQQEFTSVAELAKQTVNADPVLMQKFVDVATTILVEADNKSMLLGENKPIPDFGFDNGVGGGVECFANLDYSRGDEDPVPVKGEYYCEVSGGTWLYYLKNTCGEYNKMKLEDSELKVNFIIKADGSIDPSTISTSPLTVISSCAG